MNTVNSKTIYSTKYYVTTHIAKTLNTRYRYHVNICMIKFNQRGGPILINIMMTTINSKTIYSTQCDNNA